MLHLLAGLEVITARREARFFADAVPATKPGQCRVGKLGTLLDELFVDPDKVALTTNVEVEDLLPIGLGFLLPL